MPFINFTNINCTISCNTFWTNNILGKRTTQECITSYNAICIFNNTSMPCYGINAYTKHKQRSISCNSKKYSS